MDRLSAGYLLGLGTQMQKELSHALNMATKAGKKVATLSMNTEIRFTSPEQRAGFTKALEKAIVGIVARHTSPFKKADGSPAQGRAFRLVLGCYPFAATEKERDWSGRSDPAGEKADWKDLTLPLKGVGNE